jgi:hypothetical protein
MARQSQDEQQKEQPFSNMEKGPRIKFYSTNTHTLEIN